jgi:branched-chain amino acid transport system substrate-binding protein
VAAIAALCISGGAALAQEVKVGVVLPYTGIGAEFARQMDRGMELYLKLNPDQVKPYTITFIKRDSKAPSGADAKIAVQELLTQDKVDALAGWVYSPDAIASAPLVNAGKKLAVIMNAGTAFITNLTPDYVRTSFTMWHAGYA